MIVMVSDTEWWIDGLIRGWSWSTIVIKDWSGGEWGLRLGKDGVNTQEQKPLDGGA